jgi:hypothetical protein
MVKCPGCEKELIGNPKFCPECGKQIDGRVGTVDEVFKRRHSRKGLRIVVTAVIIIFVVAGFAYVFFSFIDINGFISPMGGISGTWEGSGTFTNGGIDCTNPACKYVGTMNPPSVILQLQQNGNYVFGTVTINIPASQVQDLISGAGCTGFDNSVSDINNGILSSTRLTFMDDGGNIWTLNFLNDNCQGTVGSNAIGCTGLQGDVSLSKK